VYMQVAFLQSSTKSTHVEPFRRIAPERLVIIIIITRAINVSEKDKVTAQAQQRAVKGSSAGRVSLQTTAECGQRRCGCYVLW